MEERFKVKVPVYEGPMDLLLHVVRQHHLELTEIPLAQITNAFLEHSILSENLDLDSAGETLYVTSLLIRMKVKALLPKEDEDEGDDLERTRARDEELEEVYREIVLAARQLAKGEAEQRKHFKRGDAAAKVEVDKTEAMLRDVGIVDLAEAFNALSKKLDKSPRQQLALFKVSVEDQSKRILSLLADRPRVGFNELASSMRDRLEAVVTFLSILELIRYGRVRVTQDQLFGEIWILRGLRYEQPEMVELGESEFNEFDNANGGD